MLAATPFLILEYEAFGAAIGMVSANLAVWFSAHIYATLRVGYIFLLPSLIRTALLAILVALFVIAVVCVPLGDPELILDLK